MKRMRIQPPLVRHICFLALVVLSLVGSATSRQVEQDLKSTGQQQRQPQLSSSLRHRKTQNINYGRDLTPCNTYHTENRKFYTFEFYFAMSSNNAILNFNADLFTATIQNSYNSLTCHDPLERHFDAVTIQDVVQVYENGDTRRRQMATRGNNHHLRGNNHHDDSVDNKDRRLGSTGTAQGALRIETSCYQCLRDNIIGNCLNCRGNRRELEEQKDEETPKEEDHEDEEGDSQEHEEQERHRIRELQMNDLDSFQLFLSAVLEQAKVDGAETLTLSTTKPNSCKGLRSGDIEFVHDQDGGNTVLNFVAVKDLPEGARIYFTNKRSNDDVGGTVVFNVPMGGISAKSLITYPPNSGNGINFELLGDTDIHLSEGGDSIRIYCYENGMLNDESDKRTLFG